MALDTTEIRVAGNGRVYVAPPGTALPVGLAAPAAAFVDVGALSDDGAVLTRSVSQDTVGIWQSTVPARYLITETEITIKMTLMQFNADTLPLYFGGGEVVTDDPDGYSYKIDSAASVDERVLLIDAFDGTIQYRFIFARSQVKENDDMTLSRSDATGLALTWGVMAGSDGSLGMIFTNDDAMAAA